MKKVLLAALAAGSVAAAPAGTALADDDAQLPPEAQPATGQAKATSGNGTVVTPGATAAPGAPAAAAAAGEVCWWNGDRTVYAENAFGQRIMESHQDNTWCAKNGALSRWHTNAEWGNGWAGWRLNRIAESVGNAVGQSVTDYDDFHYEWLSSPIGSPTRLQYWHNWYRANGQYGGTYQW